jgi:Leucine Rich repeat
VADESARRSGTYRLRMTVRVLMLLILVLSVGLALTVSQAKRQEAAIAKITRLGGIVGFDYNYWEERGNYPPWPSGDPPAPRWLRLGEWIGGSVRRGARIGLPNEGPPAPRWLLKSLGPDFFRRANFVSLAEFHQKLREIPDLAFLEDLPDVRVLHLDSRSFADSELAHARPLRLIRFLAKDSSLGDEGLAHLAHQAQLWEIDLSGTRVKDRGLVHLAGMPKLRFVDLSGLQMTDAGLAALSRLPNLERLTLAETPIGDDGLARLAGLSRLYFLDLRGTRVSDAGLVHLKEIPALAAVMLSRTGVTDAGLAHLKALPGLKAVELPKSGVTDIGVADLQRSMPKLRVERR